MDHNVEPDRPDQGARARPMPEDTTEALQAALKPGRPPVVTKGAIRPGPRSPRSRAILFLLLIVLLAAAWWGSGYLFAYTDDAYLTSDLVSVAPEVTGPVEAVHVTDNQWVTRGTPLFTIDPTPFRLELERARAQESEAQAQLPIDQAQLDDLRAEADAAYASARLTNANLNRDVPLGHVGAVSAQTLDATRAAQAESEAHVHAAQAAVSRATETLRFHQVAVTSAHAATGLAEWRLSRTQVVAPVDGQITHLVLQPGDMVSPDRPVVAVVDGHAWRVEANYKEYYLRHLSPGHTAWVWLDAHPWRLYRARIQGIAHGISRDPQGVTLLPYVSPSVDWIRLQRRIPVRIILQDSPGVDGLFMGTDARTLVIY
jgi:multidrug efflux system membrane fusion protein